MSFLVDTSLGARLGTSEDRDDRVAVASTDCDRGLVVLGVVLDVGERQPPRLVAVADSRARTSMVTSWPACSFVTPSKRSLHSSWDLVTLLHCHAVQGRAPTGGPAPRDRVVVRPRRSG